MKTSSAKAKGRRLQNWVGEKASKLTGLPCGPDCPIEPRQMGQNGVDIRLDREARSAFPWSVECKNQETWSIGSWIDQAQTNTYEGTDWLLVLSKNRTQPVVVLDAEVFFSLLEKVQRLRRTRTK